MSAGRKIVSCRLDQVVYMELLVALRSRNMLTSDRMWTLGDWIAAAILDKLKHRRRSGCKRSRKPSAKKGARDAE